MVSVDLFIYLFFNSVHIFLKKGQGVFIKKRYLLLRKRAPCQKKGQSRSVKDLVAYLITFPFYQEAKW